MTFDRCRRLSPTPCRGLAPLRSGRCEAWDRRWAHPPPPLEQLLADRHHRPAGGWSEQAEDWTEARHGMRWPLVYDLRRTKGHLAAARKAEQALALELRIRDAKGAA